MAFQTYAVIVSIILAGCIGGILELLTSIRDELRKMNERKPEKP